MEVVYGTAQEIGDKASLLNALAYVHNGSIDVTKKDALVVRPIGVMKKSRNSQLPTIIVNPHPPKKETLYPGPRKSLVTAREWLNCTEGGCIQCQKGLSLASADKIEWMINETRPMCEECAEDWRDYIETRGRGIN